MKTSSSRAHEDTPWKEFWSDQSTFDDELLRRNVSVFLENVDELMEFSTADNVLDIGCGPGFLLEALAPRVGQLYGVDVSSKYVAECRERLHHFGNVRIEQLGEDYTDLSFLEERSFNKIICLSVIQYYRRKSEVRDLMAAVKRVAAPGARFLIADISVETSLLADLASLARSAFRERMLAETIRFLGKAQFGKYARLRRRVGLLKFDRRELIQYARETGLDAELVSRRLTVNDNRSHLMLRM